MANDDKYPMIPLSSWWTVRNRFKQKIPSSVTPDYVASILNIKTSSAKGNVIPSLVKFGIIDQDGKPLDRARNWRDDDEYSEVCKQIREEIYPDGLLDALPGPIIDRPAVENWFLRRTGVGEKAARKLAAVYELLWDANPSRGGETTGKDSPKKPISSILPIVAMPVGNATNQPTTEVSATSPEIKTNPPLSYEPIHLNFNIQIVLPENSTPETYDNIFKSIATYLLGRSEE
jgi:hypothetical protein